MNKIFSLLLSITIFGAVVTSDNKRTALIYRAENRAFGQLQGDNSIALVSIVEKSGKYLCQGILLDIDLVLTAAKCIYDYDAEQLQVVHSEDNINPSGFESKQVEQVLIHPNFDTSIWTNNIGILRIDHFNSNDIIPSSTVYDKPVSGTLCYLISDNKKDDKGLPSNCRIKILDTKQCNSTLNGNLTGNIFCAAADDQQKLCTINRGSTLICDNLIAGILSYDINYENRTHLGIFTDVSEYNEWINEVFRMTSYDKAEDINSLETNDFTESTDMSSQSFTPEIKEDSESINNNEKVVYVNRSTVFNFFFKCQLKCPEIFIHFNPKLENMTIGQRVNI